MNKILNIILATLLLGAVASGQQAVKFDGSTGTVSEPASPSKTPSVERAGVQVKTTDTDLTALASTSYIEWNVPSQTSDRAIVLPAVGTGTGQVSPGRELVINVVACADNGVSDGDSTLFTVTNPTLIRLKAGTSTWVLMSGVARSSDQYLLGGLGSASQADNNNLVHIAGPETITGAKTLSESVAVNKNTNGNTAVTVTNLNAGAAANARIDLTTTGGTYSLFKASLAYGGYKNLGASDAGIYNGAAGNMSFLNDQAGGNINFAAGASSVPNLTITPAGAIIAGATGTAFTSIRQATATLVGGTVTVADTAIATGDTIIPVGTGVTNAGVLGVTITNGVGYTIGSSNILDARALAITIMEK